MDIYAFALDRHGYVPLCVMIFLYYWLSPYQLFPRPGWVDPAIYAGNMMKMSEVVMTYGMTHMSGRLAYNSMGYWLHNLAGSQWGHYIEIAIYLCMALGSIYEISKGYFSAHVIRVALAFAASSPLFVNALSHNYPDGASISLVLVVVALLIKGHRDNSKFRQGWWFLAGAATAVIYFVHPMGVISCVCAFLAFVLIYSPQTDSRWTYLRPLTVSYIGGGAVVLSIFVEAGRMLFGSTNIATLAAAKFISGRQQSLGKAYMYPVEDWLPEASRLWWVAAITLLAAGGWLLSRKQKESVRQPTSMSFGKQQFMNFSALYLAIFFGVLALSDVFGASTFLQHHHYASHILPPVFLVSIGFISISLGETDSRCGKTAYIFVIVGQWGLLEAWISNGTPLPGDGAIASAISITFAMMVISFKLLLAGQRVPSKGSSRFSGAVKMCWLLSFMIFSMICQTVNGDTKHALKGPNSPSFQAEFLAANNLSKAIWEKNKGEAIYFWFNREALNEDLDRAKLPEACTFSMRFGQSKYRFNAYDDISGRFQWDKAIWDDAFPKIGINKSRPPKARESADWPITIAVLSTEFEHASLARRVLDNYGFHVTEMTSLGRWPFPCSPKPVSVTLISLRSWAYGFPSWEKEK